MPPSFWDFQGNLGKRKGQARPGRGADPGAPPAQGVNAGHAARQGADPGLSAGLTPQGPKPLTVTQLTRRIENALDTCLPHDLLVRGEVSNYKLHAGSGHAYFTLKDPGACIDCVMFKSDFARLKFKPGDGMELLATGRVGVYPQRGRYQLYVDSLHPVGQGALELALQQIRARLEAEGLFDPDRKKPIPRYPQTIALVTSTQTAAVQDMLKVLRRFPFLRVLVCNVPVQGDGSAEKIAAALAHLNRGQAGVGGIDVILLGRGGGSLEDLWEFNEEVVARAIAASRIPVITGIGHEIDVSIADLAADHHAHTPTEAAQVAVRHWRTARDATDSIDARLRRHAKVVLQDVRRRLAAAGRHEFFRRPLDAVNRFRLRLDERQQALAVAVGERLRRQRDRLARLEARLRERHPRHLVGLLAHRLEALGERLRRAVAPPVERRRLMLSALAARLECNHPEQVLRRGYSITLVRKRGAQQVVRRPEDVRPGDTLVTRLAGGQIESTVDDSRQMKLFEG